MGRESPDVHQVVIAWRTRRYVIALDKATTVDVLQVHQNGQTSSRLSSRIILDPFLVIEEPPHVQIAHPCACNSSRSGASSSSNRGQFGYAGVVGDAILIETYLNVPKHARG